MEGQWLHLSCKSEQFFGFLEQWIGDGVSGVIQRTNVVCQSSGIYIPISALTIKTSMSRSLACSEELSIFEFEGRKHLFVHLTQILCCPTQVHHVSEAEVRLGALEKRMGRLAGLSSKPERLDLHLATLTLSRPTLSESSHQNLRCPDVSGNLLALFPWGFRWFSMFPLFLQQTYTTLLVMYLCICSGHYPRDVSFCIGMIYNRNQSLQWKVSRTICLAFVEIKLNRFASSCRNRDQTA